MAWGYRKSKKIAPGTRLNISKNGVSVTQRLGKTGVYHRTQLAGGKNRGGSSEGGCLSSILTPILGIGVVAGVLKALPPEVGIGILVIVIVLIAALVVWLIVKLVKAIMAAKARRDAQKAAKEREARKAAAEAAGLDFSDVFSFGCEIDPDEDRQKELRDLKFRLDRFGLQADAALCDNDDGRGILFYLNGREMGKPLPEAAAWLSDHFDEIEAVNRLRIDGGGLDWDDKPRPFAPIVSVQLKAETEHPKLSSAVPDVVYTDFGAGDMVVYVSSTKKIHTGSDSCSVSTYDCTPMFLQDALDKGCTPCLKCFRDD